MPQTTTSKKPRPGELIDNALQSLEEALAAGESESIRTYLDFVSRFHKYSFGNTILLASQMPTATHVAGFRAWKKLGRHVKKGERGLKIVVPMSYRKDTSATDDKDRIFFRVSHVFDVSQTDGEPLPEPIEVNGDPGVHLPKLYGFTEDHAIQVEKRDQLSSPDALGISHGGRVEILAELPPAQEFETLAHELAHELLHKDFPKGERPTKAVLETEAEAVSYVLCNAIGLTDTQGMSDYILHHDGDVDVLKASLERIRSTSRILLEALELTEGGAE